MKKRIIQLLQIDNLSKSIDLLLREVNEKEITSELTLIKARYSSNQAAKRLGVISYEKFSLENNQIRLALLNMVEEIDFEKQKELAGDREGESIKMLFAGNSPDQTAELDLEKEYIQIRTSTRSYRNRFITDEIFNFSINGFFDVVKKEKPTIVHLTGHSKKEGFVFLDEKEENIEIVPWKYIVPAIRLFPEFTNCIFINSVHSDEFGQKIAQFFPNVICMKGFVPNTEAIRFSSGFYASLSIGGDYLSAYKVSMKLIADSMKTSYSLPFNGIHYDNSIEVVKELGTYLYFKDGMLQE